MRFFVGAGLVLALMAGPAGAQMAGPACEEVSDRNLPADLAAWGGAAVEVVAASAAAGAVPLVKAGVPVAVQLAPAGTVSLRQPPEQARTPPDAHAGMVEIEVPTAGMWRLSASSPVWIDVVGPKGAMPSLAFGNLAPCTSIRKVVEFRLEPGRYLVQLSGNPGAVTRVMLSAKP